jgi:hypothetical protein
MIERLLDANPGQFLRLVARAGIALIIRNRFFLARYRDPGKEKCLDPVTT